MRGFEILGFIVLGFVVLGIVVLGFFILVLRKEDPLGFTILNPFLRIFRPDKVNKFYSFCFVSLVLESPSRMDLVFGLNAICLAEKLKSPEV